MIKSYSPISSCPRLKFGTVVLFLQASESSSSISNTGHAESVGSIVEKGGGGGCLENKGFLGMLGGLFVSLVFWLSLSQLWPDVLILLNGLCVRLMVENDWFLSPPWRDGEALCSLYWLKASQEFGRDLVEHGVGWDMWQEVQGVSATLWCGREGWLGRDILENLLLASYTH